MKVTIYARVSTEDKGQDPEVQVTPLRAWIEACGHEVEDVVTEHASGRDRRRPALRTLMDDVDAGLVEAVAVVKLDRLARSTHHLCELSARMEDAGCALMVKDQGIDTSTPTGKLLFHVLAAIAEFESDLIGERTRAGMEQARINGSQIGRPKIQVDEEAVRARHAVLGRGSAAIIAKEFGVSTKVIRRVLAPW